MTADDMLVTLIGKGNVGTNLHAALSMAGHKVQWLSGRGLNAEEIAGHIIVIAVKDDAIVSVAETVKRHFDTRQASMPNVASAIPHPLIVHTAGSIPLYTLPKGRRGVLYPMQTFSKDCILDFKEIPVFVEAEAEADAAWLEQLAATISNRVYRLDSERRKHLHLAAVFACNFVNHCYAMSAEILEQHGMSFDVMLPLIDETARKVHQLHPLEAQTGPAVRYDENVIRHQIQLLREHPFMKDLYERMSLNIHRKANNA